MASQRKAVAKAAEAEEVEKSPEDVKVHSKPRSVTPRQSGNTCCGNLCRFLFTIGFLAAAAVGVSQYTTQTNFFGRDKEVIEAYEEYKAQFMQKLLDNNILVRPPPRPLQPVDTREAAKKKEAEAAAQKPAGEAAPEKKKKKKKDKPYFDPAESATRTFTLAQLATYDGQDPEKPLLLAFKGKVYDVSKGKKHYGKGGAYHHFTGKDATRAFATGDFKNDLNGNLEGLTEEQIKSLDEWVGFYDSHKEYTYVGKLVPE